MYEPTLDEIITAGIDARLGDVFTVTAAKVKSYDGAASTVDVIPQIRRPIEREDGSIMNEDLPIVASVPIVWSATSDVAITFPINPGDFGLLLVMTYGVSSFLDTGQPSDPGDIRAHHIANAVFLPGFGPKNSIPLHAGDPDLTISAGSTVKVIVRSETEIDLIAPDVRLGSASASDPVVTQSRLLTELNAIKATLDAIHSTGIATANLGTGAVTWGFVPPYTPGTPGSPGVKAP